MRPVWVHLPRWHFEDASDLHVQVGDVFEDVGLAVATRSWTPPQGDDGIVLVDHAEDDVVRYAVTGRVADLSDDYEPVLDVGDFELIAHLQLGGRTDPGIGDRLTVVGRLDILAEGEPTLLELPDVLGDWRVHALEMQDRWEAPVRRKSLEATGTLPDETTAELYLLDLRLV